MSVVVEAVEANETAETVDRPHRLPLAAHALLLVVVLVALLPVIGTDAQFSADEGAALAAAQARADTGSWAVPHPFAAFDPTGDAFPLEKSQPVDGGYAPLPKRPLYVVTLGALFGLGGVTATMALSVVATFAAAVLAAQLARRLRPGLEVPVLWLAGLASPLLFDGYLVMAHALGAALAAGALLFALRALDRPGAGPLAGLGLCLGALALVRSEGLLFGLALAAALGLLGVCRRRPAALVTGAIAAGSVVVAEAVNTALEQSIFGVSQAHAVRGASAGWLEDRWRALFNSWLRPAYGLAGTGAALLVGVLVVGLAAVILARRRRPDVGLVLAAGCVAALLAVAALAVDGPDLVPGLLVAFPVGVWGVALLRRDALRHPVAFVLAVTWALDAAAVLATQYPFGGGAEWGGRFFAVGLVAAVPLAADGFARAAARFTPSQRALLGLCLGVVALATTVTMVGSLRAIHRTTDDVNRSITAAEQAIGTAPDGAGPVVLTTAPAYPRLAWRNLEDARWLLVPSDDLDVVLARLADLGIDEVVYVAASGERDADRLGGTGYEVARSYRGGPRTPGPWVAVLRAGAAA